MSLETHSAPAEEWFFSYNSADHESVRGVQRVLAGRGLRTFLDRNNLRPGVPWFDELEAALHRAAGALIFLGPSGIGTIQKYELQFALVRQAERERAGSQAVFRVIPVLLPGCDRHQLPGFAALNTWVELSDPEHPDELIQALGEPAIIPSPDRRARTSVCPYRGLNAFREEDSPLYFGRDAEAARLLDLVRVHQFVAVVGPSGTGKSSVVQAGLLPRLRLEKPPNTTWDAVVFSPGQRPYYDAVASLSRLWRAPNARVADVVAEVETIERQLLNGTTRFESYVREGIARLSHVDRLLVLVDQFEQIFTQIHDDSLRQRFLASVLELTVQPTCSVVITLRADYYGRAIEMSHTLSGLLETAQLNLGPIRRDDLRKVIVGPATRVGAGFESGLVERILDDVEEQPGSLPLLEFALTELWNKVPTGDFTHSAYETVGRVSGAISTRAEAVLKQLTADQRSIAAPVLTRLVKVTSTVEDGADSRQTVRLSDLDAGSRAIIEEFAQARLVVLASERGGDATAEVAHEALIRSWKSLRDWIDADVQFLRWRQNLAIFILEWERTGRDPTALLGGALLADALGWLKTHSKALSERERTFIVAGRRKQRGSKQIRWAAAALLSSAAIGGGFYYRYRQSETFQIDKIVQDAPVREAMFSGRSAEDPYVEAIVTWFAALTRLRGVDAAEAAVRAAGGLLGRCAAASIEVTGRRATVTTGFASRQAVEQLLRDVSAESAHCLRLLALTDDEKQRAITALGGGAKIEGAKGDTYGQVSRLLEAAVSLHRWGTREIAHRITQDAIAALRASREPGVSQQLAWIARNLGDLLSDDERQQLMREIDFEPRSEYYHEQAAAAFAASTVTVSTIDAFVASRENKRYSDILASEAGTILAREVRRGRVDEAVRAADRVIAALTPGQVNSDYASRITAFVLLPLPESLFEQRQPSSAIAMAERLLKAAEDVPQEDSRSRILSAVARAFAQGGQLARARDVADRCSRSLDKLYAYAAIVDTAARAER